MPFDGRRMVWGGFVPILTLGAAPAGRAGYLDGFVLAVPASGREAFIRHAEVGDPVFIDGGALRVVEGWGEDVPHGKRTDLHRAVQATVDEVVCFSWIEWPDQATRETTMKRMEQAMHASEQTDPRMDPKVNPMPFDGQRLIFGGFEVVLDRRSGAHAEA